MLRFLQPGSKWPGLRLECARAWLRGPHSPDHPGRVGANEPSGISTTRGWGYDSGIPKLPTSSYGSYGSCRGHSECVKDLFFFLSHYQSCTKYVIIYHLVSLYDIS